MLDGKPSRIGPHASTRSYVHVSGAPLVALRYACVPAHRMIPAADVAQVSHIAPLCTATAQRLRGIPGRREFRNAVVKRDAEAAPLSLADIIAFESDKVGGSSSSSTARAHSRDGRGIAHAKATRCRRAPNPDAASLANGCQRMDMCRRGFCCRSLPLSLSRPWYTANAFSETNRVC